MTKERRRARSVILETCKRDHCTLSELLLKIRTGKVRTLPSVHLQLKHMIAEEKRGGERNDL